MYVESQHTHNVEEITQLVLKLCTHQLRGREIMGRHNTLDTSVTDAGRLSGHDIPSNCTRKHLVLGCGVSCLTCCWNILALVLLECARVIKFV